MSMNDENKKKSIKAKKKAEFGTLQEFLSTRKSTKFPGEKITHTRIGNKNLNVFGGAYVINDKKSLETFYKLYYDKVIKKGLPEYLTEIQDRDNGGPILIDLDFRYNGVTERCHVQAHIDDIIDCYCDKLKDLIKITDDTRSFNIYVFEKDEINILPTQGKTADGKEYTSKDGIHMIIGLKMKHDMQKMLRAMVLESIDDVLSDLRDPDDDENLLVNNYEDILDESISTGETGWQVYGSKKPGGKPYKLTYLYKCEYNDGNNMFDWKSAEEDQLKKFKEKKKILQMFSVRNCSHWSNTQISEAMMEEWKKIEEEAAQQLNNIANQTNYMSLEEEDTKFELYMATNQLDNIKSIEDLNLAIKAFIMDSGNQQIINAHKYTMLLGEDYYKPYDKWLKVGMALQHTSNISILSWIAFSSKSDNFDWDDCGTDIPNRWDHFKKNKKKSLTLGSIKYWAKSENPEEYEKIWKETIDKYIHDTLFGKGTEYDLARLAHLMYKDRFACVNLKKNGEWWEFGKRGKYTKHVWCENESGTSLRREISKTMSQLYIKKEKEVFAQLRVLLQATTEGTQHPNQTQNNVDTQKIEELTQNTTIYNEIAIKCRRTTHKQNIMKECKDEFRDEYLLEKLDSDPYKLGCNNGIYDFKGEPYDVQEFKNNKYTTVTKYKGVFRPGCPEDYISLSTKLDYIKIDYDNEEHIKIVNEINTFMEQLFVNEPLRQYMWEHLATAVIGTNSNQTFNIYNGNGSNGKSVLVTFMKKVMGDYADISVPITLIMGNRTNIGVASPEIANLKGIRYACMQESTKGDKINDGVMKQLTGKDPLTGRKLFHDPITFQPQFSLVCCLNEMPIITSNDGGTWRRIRKVDFESKFIDTVGGKKISEVKADKQFPMDKYLEERFDTWAPFMLSMLIEIAQEKMGLVTDCEKVTSASENYRQREDYLARFMKDKIDRTGNSQDKVLKTAVKTEFQQWWRINQGPNARVPPMTELIGYLDREYEREHNQNAGRHYKGWKIIYDGFDDEEYDEEA